MRERRHQHFRVRAADKPFVSVRHYYFFVHLNSTVSFAVLLLSL